MHSENEEGLPVQTAAVRKEMNYSANCFVVDQNATPARKNGVDTRYKFGSNPADEVALTKIARTIWP